MLVDKYPRIRKNYDRHFCLRILLAETIGNVNVATIKKYIAEQYERIGGRRSRGRSRI